MSTALNTLKIIPDPDLAGTIFYIGKGQTYSSGEDRIDWHELEAMGKKTPNNLDKVAIVKDIIAKDLKVTKRKVAYFSDHKDALMYEYALIWMTTYSERLTNRSKGFHKERDDPPSGPVQQLLEDEMPILTTSICIRHTTGRRKTYHQVTDIPKFVAMHCIKVRTMKKLLEFRKTSDWAIIDCQECSPNSRMFIIEM